MLESCNQKYKFLYVSLFPDSLLNINFLVKYVFHLDPEHIYIYIYIRHTYICISEVKIHRVLLILNINDRLIFCSI